MARDAFGDLADQIASINEQVSQVIFDAVRAQLRGDNPEAAKEQERSLAKVRRSLAKAEQLLRGAQFDDDSV